VSVVSWTLSPLLPGELVAGVMAPGAPKIMLLHSEPRRPPASSQSLSMIRGVVGVLFTALLTGSLPRPEVLI
jgi:hypothetical protein